MRSLKAAALLCVALLALVSYCAAHSASSLPSPTAIAAAPLGSAVWGADGRILPATANPVQRAMKPQPAGRKPNKPKDAKGKKKAPEQKYVAASDFMGAFGSVPLNPTKHLQRVLKEDKKFVAAVLRAPLDLGDVAGCKHSDVEKDALELKKIALRINHRRVSLVQQQSWIDSSEEALKRVEDEIASTTATAKNLAEQMDALVQQKEDIANHVRREVLLKELDRTSSNLMRLKNRRVADEVRLQTKHNKFAVKNHQHNEVLARLHRMRTKQGLALGYLHDPKPYRFAQVGGEMDAEAEANAEQQTEAQAAAAAEADSAEQAEAGAEAEADSVADLGSELDVTQQAAAQADAAAATAAEAQAGTEAEAATETETASEAEATTEVEAEASSEEQQ